MSRSSRRERHGRGRRGGLLPAVVQVGERRVRLPGWRSRGEQFAALVHDAIRPLQQRWAEQLAELQVRVEEVPPEGDQPDPGVVSDGAAVPLARAEPGLLVVYRRPLELRAEDAEDLAELVHEVVVEAVAELLGLDPDEVDPDQG